MAGENGRWQLAFWVISSICGLWLLTLTTGVVANDRLRVSEDQKITVMVTGQYQDIVQRLTRMETKLENAGGRAV